MWDLAASRGGVATLQQMYDPSCHPPVSGLLAVQLDEVLLCTLGRDVSRLPLPLVYHAACTQEAPTLCIHKVVGVFPGDPTAHNTPYQPRHVRTTL